VTPDFHDGYLEGLFVSSTQAKVFLRTAAGQRYTLILQEVERLYAENFRQGNIIFDVEFFQPEQLTQDAVFEVYGYSEQHQKNFLMEQWIRGAKERCLQAVEISTSYGCSALVLFKDYELLEGYVFEQ
jgi:hypothetical protein